MKEGRKKAGACRWPDPLVDEMTSFDPGLHEIELVDLPGREIVIIGFAFLGQAPDGSPTFSRHGHCVLDRGRETARKSLLRLVLESARFMKTDVPDLFTPDAAEMFYREGGLEEVRLSGRIVAGFDAGGSPVYQRTSTAVAPAEAPGPDGMIVLSERDRGRSYVAAYRKDDSLLVSWDLRDHGQGLLRNDVVYSILEVVSADGPVAEAALLARTQEELKNVPPDGLGKWLLLPDPVEVRDPVLFQASGPFRKLTYVYTMDEARCQLAASYAESADLSERAIRDLAKEHSIPPDEAGARLVLEHRQLRDEFIERNLDNFFESTARVLEDVFKDMLTREVNNVVLADGSIPGMDLNKNPVEVRKALRIDGDVTTRKRLGLPGPGRGPGTSPRRSAEKAEARKALNKSRVEETIGNLLRTEVVGGKKTLGAAISGLSTKAVCRKLGVKRPTLYRWVRQSWINFADAKVQIGLRLRIGK